MYNQRRGYPITARQFWRQLHVALPTLPIDIMHATPDDHCLATVDGYPVVNPCMLALSSEMNLQNAWTGEFGNLAVEMD